jgi:UDP-3-O-[3-hydroxymyristoyl] glucosamine N-acyltransferase
MFPLSAILEQLPTLAFIGNETNIIKEVVSFSLENCQENTLSWVNDKNVAQIVHLQAGTIICSEKAVEILAKENAPQNANFLIVSNPRKYFADVLREFFAPKIPYSIAKSAKIHESAQLGIPIFIGENVVIEANCKIGNNCRIGHNTILHSHTEIADNVIIGCNNTIGGVGFGYEKDEEGQYILMPHIGNVKIEKNVEIGNNTCIDRAVMGSTLLKENCKIDNLVHIAHGVTIGRNSLVIANSMIAGSAVIGDNVWVAPSVSVLNKNTVGDNAFLGMGAVIIREVAENEKVVGNPGRKI